MQYGGSNVQGNIVQWLYFLFEFLAWVSTCVTFGGVLYTGNVGFEKLNQNTTASFSVDGYWDHVHVSSLGSFSYSEQPFSSSNCNSGGKGTIAMTAFAFLLLFPCMVLTLLRIFGKESTVPQITSAAQCLKIELGLLSGATFFFFLAVCIFGGACFHSIEGALSNVTATGFAYMIFCFFFLIFAVALGFYMRKTVPEYQQGAGDMANNPYQTYNPSTVSDGSGGRVGGGDEMNAGTGSGGYQTNDAL